SVIVLDRDFQKGGQTYRTTAHLTHAFDDRYYEMERIHGTEKAKQIAASHTAAIDKIESIVTRSKRSCDFARVPGYLFLDPKHSWELLQQELSASRAAGLMQAEILDEAPHSL